MRVSKTIRDKVLEVVRKNKDISFMDVLDHMKDEMNSSASAIEKVIKEVLEWWEQSGKIIQTVNRRTKEGMYRMNESSSIAKSLVSDTLEEMGINTVPQSLNEYSRDGLPQDELQKLFDKLRKGSIIKITYKSAMSRNEKPFAVEVIKIAKKGSAEQITLKPAINPSPVMGPSRIRYYLYRENGIVSFAQADMSATLTSADILKESIEEGRYSGKQLYDTIVKDGVKLGVVLNTSYYLYDNQEQKDSDFDVSEGDEAGPRIWEISSKGGNLIPSPGPLAKDYKKRYNRDIVSMIDEAFKENNIKVSSMKFYTESTELTEEWTADSVKRNAEIGSSKGYGITLKPHKNPNKHKHMLMTRSTGGKIKVAFDFGKNPENVFVGTPEEVADHINKVLGLTEGFEISESAKAIHKKLMQKGRVSPIDTDRYPKRKGLEGPFRSRKTGKVFYYDPKEGKYYDPNSDMYLDVDDVMEETLNEKLKVSDGLGAWIKDFMKSDAPQFKSKSEKEKRDMAIAAFTDAGGKLDEAKGILSVKPNSSKWRTAKLNTNKNIEGAKGVTKLKKGDTVDIHPFDGDRYVGAVDKSNQGTYFFLAKYSVNESVHDFDEIRENLRKNLTSQFVDEQRHEDMVDAVNKMSKDELKKLIRDKKNPMSKLAFRRFNRMQNPRKYPSDQLEENTNEFEMLSEENLETDRRDILMVCGPEYKSIGRLNPRESADFDRMIFLLYSQFPSDVKTARKIDDGWDFTTDIMMNSQNGKLKEKFPKSYFRLIGGNALLNDAVKMGIAEEKESIEESNILVKRGKKFQAGVPKWFGVTMTGLPKYPTQKVAGWKTELETGSGMPGYKSYLLHNDGLGTWTVFADADNTGMNPRMSPRGPLGSFKSPEEAMKFVEKAVLKEGTDETLVEGIEDIQDIVKGKAARRLKFKEGGTMKVDMTTANALLTVYDALNDANKKKFEEMLTKSKNTFMKAVDFTWKQVGVKKEGYSWDELMEEKESKMQDSFKTSSLGRISDTARQILEGKDISEAKEMYVIAIFYKDEYGATAIGSETSRNGLLKSGVKPYKEKKGLYWLTFDNEKNVEKFLEKYRSKISSAHITDKNPKNM